MKLTDNVSSLKGVGKELGARLKRLGIKTIADLIEHYPRRYEDYSQIVPIKDIKSGPVTVKGRVKNVSNRRSRRGLMITEAVIDDGTGSVKAIWFNQPYLAKQLPHGTEVYVAGVLELSYNSYALQNPTVEKVSSFPKDTARIVPIYPETEGISSKQIRGLIKQVLPAIGQVRDKLPPDILRREGLMRRAEALKQIHFPSSSGSLAQARGSLAFEELFFLILAGLSIKEEVKTEEAPHITFDQREAQDYVAALDFDLTDSQRQAAWQILQDLERPHPMNRLLEGDVGSGKTVVAIMAAVMAANSGLQATLMVPTEVLARQHHERLSKLLGKLNLKTELLTGSLTPKEKTSVKKAISSGEADIIIGTHALISSDVEFKDIGLVIIDEQHRFGVKQRQQLKDKAGRLPHLLTMTATPIPRSMALAVYGDLDISIIRELPPGRRPVKTTVAAAKDRAQVYQHIDNEIARGRQVFVVCPLISESDKLGAKSVEAEAEKLRKSIFSKRRIAVLHGRLPTSDKRQVMDQFAAGDVDILVSTTVVEVGVDIPNATVMLVEGAERFGLATLHQLRGRVGRSQHQSYCYLISSNDSQVLSRLKLLEQHNDGFRLAAEDLKIRGPGQIYGTRQHGLLTLKIADITDVKLVAKVRNSASEFFKDKQHMVQYPRIVKYINKLKTVTSLD